MAAIAPVSTADLVDLLKKSGVLTAARLKALPEAAELPDDTQQAAEQLVQKGFVTKFQASQLLLGRHKGFRIGPYAVQDLLGRGGMGAVYLAEHMDLHRKVALKVLAPVRGEGQQLATERFLREARAAAALDHPNIVRVFDVGRHGDTPYIVMEFVDGETLQQMLDKNGPIAPASAAEFIAQAAAGLQHAHERGLVHRDIKPGNLIRDKFGVVKVLDMGLARSGSDQDKLTDILDEGAVVGTADFISPEQAINSGIDGRADLYSLGATLFTLLAGKTPFEGNTAQKLMQHQIKPAPLSALGPAVPAGLALVVEKMLAKTPEERYQFGAEVAEALAPWAGASVRVAAALHRTDLGQSSLSGLLAGTSSSRTHLAPTPQATGDSSSVNPSDAARPTSGFSGAETVRNRPPAEGDEDAGAAPPGRKRPVALVAALAVALLAACGVGAWLAFGPEKTAEKADAGKTEQPTPAPPDPNRPPSNPTNPEPLDAQPPTVPHSGERVLYKLDLARVPPFVIRSLNETDPKDPNKKTTKITARDGAGTPPAEWQGRSYGKNSEMEFFSAAFEGKPALGIRNSGGQPSAMLFSPNAVSATGLIRVKIEYQAGVRDRKFTVRLKVNDERKAWDLAHPAPTGAGWRSTELVADLKGATGGMIEFHNTDDTPGAVVCVRSFVVTEAPAGTPPTPLPTPAVSPGTGPDYRAWAEGKSLYALDVEKVAPFRVTKEKNKRTAGDPEVLPPGVGCQAWKEGAAGEFRRDTVAGAPALGITNLNDAKSGQFTFRVEGSLKVALRPGQAYRVKVTYRTAQEATGSTTVHLTPPYKNIASAQLTASGDRWATATVNFVRPPAEDMMEVRLIVENTAVGEGNTLWVKSVEILELNPPKK